MLLSDYIVNVDSTILQTMENIDKKQTNCTEKHLRHIALSGQKRGCFCADNEGNENKNFHFHKSKNAIRKKKKIPRGSLSFRERTFLLYCKKRRKANF